MIPSEIQSQIDSVPYWFHKIKIGELITPGVQDGAGIFQSLDLPEQCGGLRVLDIGTRDGLFAFEMEKRGANVIAIDYMPPEKTGFKTAAKLLNSKIPYHQENIYNITFQKYGTFDLVLFFGVLYHLPDPLLALQTIRPLCRNHLYLESLIADQPLIDFPLMQFLPKGTFDNNQNYWAPNMLCLEKMLDVAGFESLAKTSQLTRGYFKCKIKSVEHEYLHRIARGKELPK